MVDPVIVPDAQRAARLAGKIAIVTGASRGIGRAIALRLAREGSALVLAARDQKTLIGVADEIAAGGGVASWVAVDLRVTAAPAAVVRAALEAYGAIDIVVNNAGATRRGDFLELSEADWADGFALKFFGAVRLVRAAWPHLQARRGAVLNIIGVGGPHPRSRVYDRRLGQRRLPVVYQGARRHRHPRRNTGQRDQPRFRPHRSSARPARGRSRRPRRRHGGRRHPVGPPVERRATRRT